MTTDQVFISLCRLEATLNDVCRLNQVPSAEREFAQWLMQEVWRHFDADQWRSAAVMVSLIEAKIPLPQIENLSRSSAHNLRHGTPPTSAHLRPWAEEARD